MNRQKIVAMAIAVVAVVGTAGLLYASSGGGQEAAAAGHGGEHASSLSPEKLKDLLWRTLNFAALLVILIKYLGKPIVNGLSSRRETIKARFDDLEGRKGEAERTYREYEHKLAAIEQEVKSILAAAVAQGEAEKQRIIDDATRAASDIRRQAEMAVQQELAAATRVLRQEVADKAVEIAEGLIRKNLQPGDQTRLIEGYLDQALKDHSTKVQIQ